MPKPLNLLVLTDGEADDPPTLAYVGLHVSDRAIQENGTRLDVCHSTLTGSYRVCKAAGRYQGSSVAVGRPVRSDRSVDSWPLGAGKPSNGCQALMRTILLAQATIRRPPKL